MGRWASASSRCSGADDNNSGQTHLLRGTDPQPVFMMSEHSVLHVLDGWLSCNTCCGAGGQLVTMHLGEVGLAASPSTTRTHLGSCVRSFRLDNLSLHARFQTSPDILDTSSVTSHRAPRRRTETSSQHLCIESRPDTQSRTSPAHAENHRPSPHRFQDGSRTRSFSEVLRSLLSIA